MTALKTHFVKSFSFLLNICQSLYHPFVDARPKFRRPQNSEALLIITTMRKKVNEQLSHLHLFFISLLNATGQDKHIESLLHLQNFIRGKLIEYTFSSLSLSFFFFLFLTFGNEGKCIWESFNSPIYFGSGERKFGFLIIWF